MARDSYEISIWEDYVVDATENVPRHFEERKVAVIGSDSITANCRAMEPKLVENINGTNTFTFKMFYVCKYDEFEDLIYQFQTSQGQDLQNSQELSLVLKELKYNNDTYQNPFLNLLVNERKIKVKWKGKWYDLVIKNCQEDSGGKSITYTCKDLYINELSKTGFDLVLDTDLGNNQGTVTELAQTVLEGTDWQVQTEASDIIQQKKEEPVYAVELAHGITANNETTGAAGQTIAADKQILVFYEQIQTILNSINTTSSEPVSGTTYLQFAYADSYVTDTNAQLVINADCYSIENITWTWVPADGTTDPYFQFSIGGDICFYVRYTGGVSDSYRASRLVRSQQCILDPLTGKYCYVYNAVGASGSDISVGDTIYGYRSIEYKDPTFVNNVLVNPKDFTNFDGWNGDNLSFRLYPYYNAESVDIETYSAKSYLHIKGAQNVLNDGCRQQSNFLPDGFAKGERYVFRMRAMSATGTNEDPSGSYTNSYENDLVIKVREYHYDNGRAVINTDSHGHFSSNSNAEQWYDPETGWFYRILTCVRSITRANIYNNRLGLFLCFSDSTNNIWVEEVQFFPLVYGKDGNNDVMMLPGEMDKQSVAQTYYTYYNHTKSISLIDPKDINILYQGTTDSNLNNCIVPVYNDNFVKIRSINAKQSNRFNIIQTLAETFECWARFDIEHDENTGRTLYREDGTPEKYVTFKNEIGQETGIGFIYGIDLKTIQRTIQSDQIVTKTIVGTNSNQFATNGFCTISRSIENYPRTNFILNFDYYIAQGLLNGGELNRDLYLSTEDAIGYYYWLNKYNTEYDQITEYLTQKETELSKQQVFLKVYENAITAYTEQIQNTKNELIQLAGATSWKKAQTFIKKYADAPEVKNRMVDIYTKQNELSTYIDMRDSMESSVNALTTLIENGRTRQKNLTDDIKELHYKFYQKYSRFLQEGSWKSEDYIDDNLYYLDGLSVAYTSSRPQISYNISVLRLSSLEEFKNKIFHLGDISFIQDTEFFGYVYPNGIKTPYKEKVLVSEITSNFEEPEKDVLKIQNYKTQFEDLFQRITSTTQSLQYASGNYARAAAIVEPNGTINPETLQNSINVNEQLVYSAQNESVLSDSTGITVSDTTNPNNKTKVTSGGVFITTDGGATWINAIKGNGISTSALGAGSINTNNIYIVQGGHSTFRWDAFGINAYDLLRTVPEPGEEPEIIGVNTSKFVRYDHFGVYGYEGTNDFNPATEDEIWRNAKFGMTWEGFFVKNKDGSHYVEVSSTNDIQVMYIPTGAQNESDYIARVKIGKLDDNLYGMRLKDENGNTTLETGDDGTLWLKDALNITSDTYSIRLGHLGGSELKDSGGNDLEDSSDEPLAAIGEVFNANDRFVVYEDGSLVATDGTFSGIINATGGHIGNLTITQVENAAAQVNILGDEIQFVVNNANLTFDQNGLTINQAGFRILDENNAVVFEYTDSDGLRIKGSGEFTGVVNAERIEASSGTIGGFVIGEGKLTSSESGSDALNASIQLLGAEGKIIANSIDLGNATLTDRLNLGSFVHLFNPTEDNDHSVLTVEKLLNDQPIKLIDLKQDGILTIGTINLDGETSTISGPTDTFEITPTVATFNNIVAKGKIISAIFETGKIQSVGGAMYFKPSYKVLSQTGSDNNILTIDYVEAETEGSVEGEVVTNEQLNTSEVKKHYVYLVGHEGKFLNNGKPFEIESDIGSEVTIVLQQGQTLNPNSVATLIDIGKDGAIAIGVNSTDYTYGEALAARGLTISEFEEESLTFNQKTFLGDLSSVNLNGYGLYSDNVYLNGSLTTQIVTNNNTIKYAGVNTLGGVTSAEISNDNSRIVFWGGSDTAEDKDIAKAPFQVTQNGSIYARQGLFEGAIITKSEIRGADIYTARVHGRAWSADKGLDQNEQGALSFFNTGRGIAFYNGDWDGDYSNASETLTIGNEGLSTNNKKFITIEDVEINNVTQRQVNALFTTIHTDAGENAGLEIKDLSIKSRGNNNLYIAFTSNDVGLYNTDDRKIVLNQNQINLVHNQVYIDRTLILGNSARYSPVVATVDNVQKTIGYDLYIS